MLFTPEEEKEDEGSQQHQQHDRAHDVHRKEATRTFPMRSPFQPFGQGSEREARGYRRDTRNS